MAELNIWGLIDSLEVTQDALRLVAQAHNALLDITLKWEEGELDQAHIDGAVAVAFAIDAFLHSLFDVIEDEEVDR